MGDPHGCYKRGPLEVNSYTPLVAARWNIAISATDHCAPISATKTGGLEEGGENEFESECVFFSRGEKERVGQGLKTENKFWEASVYL